MKNGQPIDMETRLNRIEADVKEIKALLLAKQPVEEPWWKSVVGSFANDPVYEEILRLGNEIREKERQKVRRKSAKRKAKTA